MLRNVLSKSDVAAAMSAVDTHATTFHERKGELRTSALYGRQSEPLKGDGRTGRLDMGGLLGWEAPHNAVFRQALCHPQLVPALTELLGVGYRLDHSPLLLGMDKGAEGHTLHGGAVTVGAPRAIYTLFSAEEATSRREGTHTRRARVARSATNEKTPRCRRLSVGRRSKSVSACVFFANQESGEPAWPLAYSFMHGQMRNQLLTVVLQLTDVHAGDGGFCVVPGSHKSNFPIPPALADIARRGRAKTQNTHAFLRPTSYA